MTRAERAAEATRLRQQGLIYREIAERMGISYAYARALVVDPTGDADRTRKRSYAGACESCGGPTNGSNGRAKAPRYCSACAPDAYRLWTRQAIVEAIHEFHRRYGRRPVVTDWNRSPAMRAQFPTKDWPVVDERWDAGNWPPVTVVQRVFGSWQAAIRAAGFQLSPGHYVDESPERRREAALGRKVAA